MLVVLATGCADSQHDHLDVAQTQQFNVNTVSCLAVYRVNLCVTKDECAVVKMLLCPDVSDRHLH